MHFFSVVFTLISKDPRTNKYIDMFWIMFRSLYQAGTFDLLEDRMYVMADDDTWAEIHRKWPMDGLTPYPQWVQIPRPTTLIEGIARRYEFFSEIPGDTMTLYLDVDHICLKKFRPAIPPDTIVVLPEGGRADPNYCGEGGWATLDHEGLSAGFWAVRPGPNTRALMDEIAASVRRGPHNFYTCEQPHFNAVITKKSPVLSFAPPLVSFNGHNMYPHTCFINCAGEPGDGPLHYQKMLALESQLNLTSSTEVPPTHIHQSQEQ